MFRIRASNAINCLARRNLFISSTFQPINNVLLTAPASTSSRFRLFSTNIESFKELNKKCLDLLENKDNLHESRLSADIIKLMEEWTPLWASAGKHFVRNHDPREDDIRSSGADVLDRLAHLLLDLRKVYSNTKQDRTMYDHALSLSLSFWSKCPPSTENGERAEALLRRMIKEGVLDVTRASRKKLEVAYGSVIQAYSISIDRDGSNGALKAIACLNELETNLDSHASVRIQNSAIHGCALRGMVDEAEQILDNLEKASKNDSDVFPDVLTYSSCLNAYSKHKGKVNGKPLSLRAEELLDRMMKRYDETGDIRVRPNQYTFGTAISLFATSPSKNNAKDADRILQRLIEFHEKETLKGNLLSTEEEMDYSTEPGTGHFVSCLLAYQRRQDIQRIEELLFQMESLYQAGNDKVKPDYRCFVIYLDALSKAGESEKAEEVLTRIENLFAEDESFSLNNYGYNLCIDAWTRSRKGSMVNREEHARAIIQRMKDLAMQTQNDSLLPDMHTYTSLMGTILKDRKSDIDKKCEDIIALMENGNENVKPDAVAYNHLICAYQISRKPEKTESVLERMQASGVRPNIICYNSVLNAYGKNVNDQSVLKVLEILEKLESIDMVKPLSYAICLDALARSNRIDRVEKANAIFERCLERFQNKSRKDALDRTIFDAMLNVYLRSDDTSKARNALNVIKLMGDYGIEASIISYNIVISTCSRTPERADTKSKKLAVEISARIMDVIRNSSHLKANDTTYLNLLWVCSNISEMKERRATLAAIFKMCCNDGLLTPKALSALKQLDHNLFWKLVGEEKRGGRVEISSLDASWSARAKR